MTLIQKFDAVLDALYDISGKRPTVGRIRALLRKRKQDVSEGEVWDIFRKMRREDLLHPEVTAPQSKRPNEILHLITFEGKLMKERNGLDGKIKKENRLKTRVTILEILTFLVALTTLIYSTCSSNTKCCDTGLQTTQQDISQTDSMTQLKQKTEQGTYPDSNILSRQSQSDTMTKKGFSADTTKR